MVLQETEYHFGITNYSEKCGGNTCISVYFGFRQENIIYSWNFKVYIESEQADFDYRLFAKVNIDVLYIVA